MNDTAQSTASLPVFNVGWKLGEAPVSQGTIVGVLSDRSVLSSCEVGRATGLPALPFVGKIP